MTYDILFKIMAAILAICIASDLAGMSVGGNKPSSSEKTIHFLIFAPVLLYVLMLLAQELAVFAEHWCPLSQIEACLAH